MSLSGELWLASNFLYGSCIRDSLPVYPDASTCPVFVLPSKPSKSKAEKNRLPGTSEA